LPNYTAGLLRFTHAALHFSTHLRTVAAPPRFAHTHTTLPPATHTRTLPLRTPARFAAHAHHGFAFATRTHRHAHLTLCLLLPHTHGYGLGGRTGFLHIYPTVRLHTVYGCTPTPHGVLVLVGTHGLHTPRLGSHHTHTVWFAHGFHLRFTRVCRFTWFTHAHVFTTHALPHYTTHATHPTHTFPFTTGLFTYILVCSRTLAAWFAVAAGLPHTPLHTTTVRWFTHGYRLLHARLRGLLRHRTVRTPGCYTARAHARCYAHTHTTLRDTHTPGTHTTTRLRTRRCHAHYRLLLRVHTAATHLPHYPHTTGLFYATLHLRTHTAPFTHTTGLHTPHLVYTFPPLYRTFGSLVGSPGLRHAAVCAHRTVPHAFTHCRVPPRFTVTLLVCYFPSTLATHTQFPHHPTPAVHPDTRDTTHTHTHPTHVHTLGHFDLRVYTHTAFPLCIPHWLPRARTRLPRFATFVHTLPHGLRLRLWFATTPCLGSRCARRFAFTRRVTPAHTHTHARCRFTYTPHAHCHTWVFAVPLFLGLHTPHHTYWFTHTGYTRLVGSRALLLGLVPTHVYWFTVYYTPQVAHRFTFTTPFTHLRFTYHPIHTHTVGLRSRCTGLRLLPQVPHTTARDFWFTVTHTRSHAFWDYGLRFGLPGALRARTLRTHTTVHTHTLRLPFGSRCGLHRTFARFGLRVALHAGLRFAIHTFTVATSLGLLRLRFTYTYTRLLHFYAVTLQFTHTAFYTYAPLARFPHGLRGYVCARARLRTLHYTRVPFPRLPSLHIYRNMGAGYTRVGPTVYTAVAVPRAATHRITYTLVLRLRLVGLDYRFPHTRRFGWFTLVPPHTHLWFWLGSHLVAVYLVTLPHPVPFTVWLTLWLQFGYDLHSLVWFVSSHTHWFPGFAWFGWTTHGLPVPHTRTHRAHRRTHTAHTTAHTGLHTHTTYRSRLLVYRAHCLLHAHTLRLPAVLLPGCCALRAHYSAHARSSFPTLHGLRAHAHAHFARFPHWLPRTATPGLRLRFTHVYAGLPPQVATRTHTTLRTRFTARARLHTYVWFTRFCTLVLVLHLLPTLPRVLPHVLHTIHHAHGYTTHAVTARAHRRARTPHHTHTHYFVRFGFAHTCYTQVPTPPPFGLQFTHVYVTHGLGCRHVGRYTQFTHTFTFIYTWFTCSPHTLWFGLHTYLV